MFYVLENAKDQIAPSVAIDGFITDNSARSIYTNSGFEDYGASDVELVDDALLNTSPHNVIERQLLKGDVVGLALMSGAIIWSAMGAFG